MPKATTIKAVILTRANADGRHTIYIRITSKSKPVYISTDIAVMQNAFNSKGSIDNPVWISKKHPLSSSYNELIKQKLISFDSHRHEKGITSLEIKERIIKPYDRNCFITFWLKIAEEKEKTNGFYSKQKYTAECNKFAKRFPAAKWSDINYANIKEYELFLLTVQKNNRNTTSKSLEFFKEIVTQYKKRNKIQEPNPFDEFAIYQVTEVVSNAKANVLEPMDINVLEAMVFKQGTHLYHATNIFLAQLFAMGARIGEALQFENKNITETHLSYVMEKKKGETPKMKKVRITPRLQRLIDIYYNKDNKYLFPYMEGAVLPEKHHTDEQVIEIEKAFYRKIDSARTMVGTYLKEACKKAKLKVYPSPHSARHTVSHILEEAGIDKKLIQNTLGHDTLEETENYLKNGRPLMVDDTPAIFANCLNIA